MTNPTHPAPKNVLVLLGGFSTEHDVSLKSGTGVIRRHPDIKWLRRETDIPALARTQLQLLDALWPTLKPGGLLLYCTCSVLPAENMQVIRTFLGKTPDAQAEPIPPMPDTGEPGWAITTGEQGMDGFFYARLRKKADA